MSDIKGVKIKDIFGVSKPLEKLIDCTARGIGKIYEPTHIRRMAESKAYEIQKICEATGDNISIPTIYANGEIKVDSSNTEQLLERTNKRFLYQELTKQRNIDFIVNNAAECLSKEEEVSDDQVDKDWLLRFFNCAGEISNETMQKIWGNILSGEIKKPTTYSLRTLELLRNMTQREAELFNNVCNLALTVDFKRKFLFNDNKLMGEFGIKYNDILELEGCGLISGNSMITLDLQFDKNNENKILNTENLLIKIKLNENINKIIKIGVYIFTKSGEEIYNVIEKNKNNEYCVEVAKKIKNANKDCKISLHTINFINEEVIDYKIDDILL